MRTIAVNCYDEFETAGEALQWACANGCGEAILVGGKYLVCDESEVERLAADGIEFAKLVDHEMPDGTSRIMTIPVND
jgi:hypothetical protein